MNDLKIFTEQFNLKNPDLCWKHPNSDMLAWANDQERRDRPHGMGDLTEPCTPRPGETCPACGIHWE
jgi:hypothetical protein